MFYTHQKWIIFSVCFFILVTLGFGIESNHHFRIPDGFSVELGYANGNLDRSLGKSFFNGNSIMSGFQLKIPKGFLNGVFFQIRNNFSIDGGKEGSEQGKGFFFRTDYELGIERQIKSLYFNASVYRTSFWKGSYIGLRMSVDINWESPIRPFFILDIPIPTANNEIIAGDDLYADPLVVQKCILYGAGVKGSLEIAGSSQFFRLAAIGHSCGALGYEREVLSAIQGEIIINIPFLKSGASGNHYVTISPRFFGQLRASENSLTKTFFGTELMLSLEVPFFKRN